MHVLRLTNALEEKILAQRRARDLIAETIASRVIRDMQRRGDTALFSWTKRFDRVALTPDNVWVSPQELRGASRRVSAEFLDAVNHAARNIRAVARRQRPREWTVEVEPGVRASQRVQPIETVGCYIPGGRFSLVSTLLMTAIPAQQAGVRKIVIASPQPSDQLLAAATTTLGLRHIARVGGAQAIAALAYGTETIPRVDKIFGPGNRYVTAAKRLVSGDCAIELLAGPTEAIVFAEHGNPRFIAADLLAQSEHDPDAIALFVTTSTSLGRDVAAEIERQLSGLPKASPAWQSLAKNGAVLVARRLADAVQFINRFAPEHLSLSCAATEYADRFDSAGSIFLGDWSAQSYGDYATGTNHVLPTGGVARARGGLSTADFVKCVSVQRISRAGCARLAPVVVQFAKAEGLLAHGRSAEVRR